MKGYWIGSVCLCLGMSSVWAQPTSEVTRLDTPIQRVKEIDSVETKVRLSTPRSVSTPTEEKVVSDDAIGDVLEKMDDASKGIAVSSRNKVKQEAIQKQIAYLKEQTKDSPELWTIIEQWLVQGAYRWSLGPEEKPDPALLANRPRMIRALAQSDYHRQWLEALVRGITDEGQALLIAKPATLTPQGQEWLQKGLGTYRMTTSDGVKNTLTLSWGARGLRVEARHEEKSATTCQYEGRCFVLGRNLLCVAKDAIEIQHQDVLYGMVDEKVSPTRLQILHNATTACDLGALLNGEYTRDRSAMSSLVSAQDHQRWLEESSRYRQAVLNEKTVEKDWSTFVENEPQWAQVMQEWVARERERVLEKMKGNENGAMDIVIAYRLAHTQLMQAVLGWVAEADPVRWNAYWGERLTPQSMTWWQIVGGTYKNESLRVRIEPYRDGVHVIVEERMDGTWLPIYHGTAIVVGDLILSVDRTEPWGAEPLFVMQYKEDATQKVFSVLATPTFLQKERRNWWGDWLRVYP